MQGVRGKAEPGLTLLQAKDLREPGEMLVVDCRLGLLGGSNPAADLLDGEIRSVWCEELSWWHFAIATPDKPRVAKPARSTTGSGGSHTSDAGINYWTVDLVWSFSKAYDSLKVLE